MSLSLHEHIASIARANPLAPAMIHEGRVYAYGQLEQLIAAVALHLQQQGIQPGAAVGLGMARTPLHMTTMLAIGALGAYSVPLNPTLSREVREQLAAKFQIQAAITDRQEPALAGCRQILLNTIRIAPDSPGLSGLPKVAADTPFRIILTSGTTGVPKGIRFTHAEFMLRTARAIEGCSAATRLVPPDLHVSVGTTWPLSAFHHGGTLIFPASQSFSDLVSAVQLHAATHVVMSPWAAEQLLTLLPPQGQVFPSVQHFRLVGGAPTPRLLRELLARVSPNVYSQYALTETGTITKTTTEELLRLPGCNGRLRDDTRAKVIDAEGNILPPGQSGELCFSVTPMAAGYHRDPEHTAVKFRDGWFHTGDIGRITEDGLIYVEGRLDDLLNLKGHKYLPSLIETALQAHPQVRECAAFLWTDATGEPQLAAALVLKMDALPADLAPHAAKALGPIATPQRFLVLRELPRNASGKIMRAELPRLAAGAWSGAAPPPNTGASLNQDVPHV